MKVDVNKELRDTVKIEEVITRLGVNLSLKKRGSKLLGNCITGHSSESKSCFHVFDNGFYCHSCGAKGNIFELVKLAKGVDFREARIWIIDEFRPELRQYKKQSIEDTKTPSEYYLKALLYEELFKRGQELLYSSQGDEARAYLIGERGYDLDKLKATEWVYLPTDKESRAYLLDSFKDANEEVKAYIKGSWDNGKFKGLSLTGYFGDVFRLAFPYRDSRKNITGYLKRSIASKGVTVKKKDKVFENVRWDSTPGLSKKDLFNIWRYRDKKELLLVEGYPDALYFHTLGLDCVAVGQGALGAEHIKSLKDRNIKSVVISFDNDKEGREDKGDKHTQTAIDLLLKSGIRPLVIPPISLAQYKDLDELLGGEGDEELLSFVRKNTVSYFEYLLQVIIDKYGKIENVQGELSSKNIDEFLEEIVETAQGIESPLDRQRFTKAFTSLEPIKEYGITEDSLLDTVDRIRYNKEKAERNLRLNEILKNVNDLQTKGEVNEALDHIETETKNLRLKRGQELLEAYSFEDWEEDIANAPPALKTGIKDLDKILRIPQAAITLIGGRPRHGKTTLMYNLLLSMAELYQDKKFYFFSYEEPKKYLLVKILNKLIDTSLIGLYSDYPVNTNIEFIKAYLKDRRDDIPSIEAGKAKLKSLIDSNRLEVIGKSYTVEELRSLIPYLAQKEEVGAIFLDYIQKIPASAKVNGIRERIAHVSNEVLITAKETGLPLILGAQFNREGVKKDSKKKGGYVGRPNLNDLKEAGNLEEDANLVIGIYNENVETAEPDEKLDREISLEIDIFKNRDGGMGRAYLNFDRYTSSITDQEEDVL